MTKQKNIAAVKKSLNWSPQSLTSKMRAFSSLAAFSEEEIKIMPQSKSKLFQDLEIYLKLSEIEATNMGKVDLLFPCKPSSTFYRHQFCKPM